MESENDVIIRIKLKGRDSEKFRELQDRLGIQAKTEVIRFSINYTHDNYNEG